MNTPKHIQDALGRLRVGSNNAAVEGRRYATVKAQGAYKLRDSSTIPKKLGAKKTGDSYVITGNIIYKQRGTKWFAGENCGMGRDHTIFSLATGYVKYYKDPAKHPKRQYIGVVFDKDDKLPYQPHQMRRRKLNMVAVPVPPPPTEPEISASGIPTQVVRQGVGRRPHPRDERVMRLQRDGSYAYAEENWRLGTLVRTEKRKLGSRRVAMRHRRRRAVVVQQEMRSRRLEKNRRRNEAWSARMKAKHRKLREHRERIASAQQGSGGGGGNVSGQLPPAGGELPPRKPEPPRAEV